MREPLPISSSWWINCSIYGEMQDTNVLLTTTWLMIISQETAPSIIFSSRRFTLSPRRQPWSSSVLCQLYPAFDVAIAQHWQVTTPWGPAFDPKNGCQLILQPYVRALINAVPAELMRDQVHICVDFSQGNLYTTMSFNHLAPSTTRTSLSMRI